MHARHALTCLGMAFAFSALSLVPNSQQAAAAEVKSGVPSSDSSQVRRGRYMIVTNNCNDCHTPGYPQRDGKVPEREWLLGSGPLGFKGPWGTTYAPNLRLTVRNMTEAQWVTFAKTLNTKPPMPWFNLNQTSDQDLRAMYRFIKQLGPAGEPARTYLPPGHDPPPALFFCPQPPRKKAPRAEGCSRGGKEGTPRAPF